MKKFFLLVLLIFSFCAFHVDDACAKRVGAWDVWQKVDEMDDSTLLGAITISKTGVRNSAGIVKYPGLGIIIRKNSDIAMCVLQEMPWLGTQSDIEIQYRLGKEKAEYSPCWETEEFSAVLIHPENFVTKLYGHKTLHVRITARSGEVYTVTFNISGAREALKDIAKAAGWK